MTGLLNEMRYALRQFRKSPRFAAVAVLTLALGIGANTAIFSVVNAVLLRPLPYHDPVGWCLSPAASRCQTLTILPRKATPSLVLAHSVSGPLDMLGHGEPRSIPSALVGGGLFETLEVKPLLGRTLTAADDQLGRARVVVTSYGYGSDGRLLY